MCYSKTTLGGFQKARSPETSNFWLAPPPCSFLFILHVTLFLPQHMFSLVSYPSPSSKRFHDAYEFLNEKSRSEKRENNFFEKTQHKRWQCFLHRYIHDNNKNIYMFIKNVYAFLIKKTFSKCQASYQKELYLLFEKSGNIFTG